MHVRGDCSRKGSRLVGDRVPCEVIVELLGIVFPVPFWEDRFLGVSLHLVLLLEVKDTGKMVK